LWRRTLRESSRERRVGDGLLGERDAAPTGLEFFVRGVYVPLFLSPIPSLYLSSSIPSTVAGGEEG
jgi:hypothetical protein